MTTGDETGLKVTIMGEAGSQSGRLANDDPWGPGLLEEGGAAVTVLLFTHYQQQPDRGTLRRLQSACHGQPGLHHGGTSPLHVGAAKTVDNLPILPWPESLQVPGRDGINMADQIQDRLTFPHCDQQVVTLLLHLLALNRETGPSEDFFQV